MILWVFLKKQIPRPWGLSILVSPMYIISAFSKNLGALKVGSVARTVGELFLTISNSFNLSQIDLSSLPMKAVSQLRSSRQNWVFSSIFSSELSSISNLLLILPMRSVRVRFISSMDLNLHPLICSSEFSVKRTDSFSVCSSFFLLIQPFIIVLQLSWKSVRILSSSSQDSSILRMRSESSSFLKSLLKARRQCSMNLLISMESWFLCVPWMVRQMEQMRPLSLQLESMQTKVGFWPWEWQLQGLMKSLKHFENCCTSAYIDISIYFIHPRSYNNQFRLNSHLTRLIYFRSNILTSFQLFQALLNQIRQLFVLSISYQSYQTKQPYHSLFDFIIIEFLTAYQKPNQSAAPSFKLPFSELHRLDAESHQY